MHSSINNIKQQLKQYKKKYYENVLLKGFLLTLSLLSSAYVTAVIFEYFAHGDSSVRAFLFYGLISFALVITSIWIIYPIYQIINNNRFLSDNEASNQIGNYFPDIKDKLINTLQLSSLSYSDSSLIAASLEQRTQTLSNFNFAEAVDTKRNRRYLKYLYIPLGVLLVTWIINSDIIAGSTDRIINFNTKYEPKAPFSFKLNNENLLAFKGDDYTIRLELLKADAPFVYVWYNGIKRKMIKNEEGIYTYTISKINQSSEFRFEASGFNSNSYQLQVVDRPELVQFKVNFAYPKYLQKINTSIENSGTFNIPEGTNVTWEIETNSTDKLNILFSDSISSKKKKISTHDYVISRSFKNTTEYEILLENSYANNKDKFKYTVQVVKDKYPGIRLEQFKDTLLYNYLLLGGNVFDDYGISSLKLFYNIISEDGKAKFSTSKSISIPIKKEINNQNFFYQLQIDQLELDLGEKVEYYLKVWDNDGVNGRKSTKSSLYTFEVPSEKEIKQQEAESADNTKNQINNTLDKAKDIHQQLKSIQDKLKTKKKLDWNDKKEIKDLLKKHKELEKELERMKELNKLQNEKSKMFKELDKDIEDKIDNIQKLMDELLDDETKKLMEELKKLMNQNINQKDIQDILKKMESKDEVMEKEIERALEMFKEMQFQKKLDDITQDLKKLAEEQKNLSEETEQKEKSKEELSNEQQEINEKFEDLKKEMDQLEKMNNDLKNSKEMDNTSDKENEIDQDLKNSKEQLEKNNSKKASESQKDASKKMEEMSDQLSSMQQEMQNQQMAEDLNSLRSILENLITISHNQERIMDEMRNVKSSDPKFITLSQEQLKLADDAKIIEDSLYALAERVFEIKSFVTREVSNMNDNIQGAVEALKQRNRGKAISSQKTSMTSMNNLALLLDDALKQMQQQMAQQQQGDQMCNKPGSGKKPKMGDMQKQLNSMMQQLKDGQKQGRELSQQLSKMAAKQEMIRRALKKMEEDMKMKGQNPGDNLSNIQKEMEKTEEDIINGKLTNELIKRQEKILTRLLEAEKASRERDQDDKRESKSGQENDKKVPPAFEKYIKEKEKQIEFLKTISPSFTPYYKEKANEYFQKIEN